MEQIIFGAGVGAGIGAAIRYAVVKEPLPLLYAAGGGAVIALVTLFIVGMRGNGMLGALTAGIAAYKLLTQGATQPDTGGGSMVNGSAIARVNSSAIARSKGRADWMFRKSNVTDVALSQAMSANDVLASLQQGLPDCKVFYTPSQPFLITLLLNTKVINVTRGEGMMPAGVAVYAFGGMVRVYTNPYVNFGQASQDLRTEVSGYLLKKHGAGATGAAVNPTLNFNN